MKKRDEKREERVCCFMVTKRAKRARTKKEKKVKGRKKERGA